MDFIRNKLLICCRRKRRSGKPKVKEAPIEALKNTVQIDGIIVQLKKGDITKETVDVIVNSTNKSLDLNSGVSGAILNAAGSSVKEECKKIGARSINGVVVTGSGKLRCLKIVHIFGQKTDIMIAASVQEALALCDELNIATVAFPAIGTGQGATDPQVAIKAIFYAIDNYFLPNTASSLKTITIVALDTSVHDSFATFFHERQQMSDEGIKAKESTTHLVRLKLPEIWTPMNVQEYLKVTLEVGSAEYKQVVKDFTRSCKDIAVKVIQIERIQNCRLWQSYSVRKQAVDRKYPNVANEQILYHGTTHEITLRVNRTGFNRSFCGRNAIAFGKGTYFAKNAQYSCNDNYSNPSDQGYKYMFQARVITGRLCLGNISMMEPTPVDRNKDPNDLCDCAVDNISNPSIFVIFCDDGAYPEYIITFKI